MDDQSIYHKFNVRRTDGKDDPGQKHDGCDYLIVDLNHDEQALAILDFAAYRYASTRPTYAESLRIKADVIRTRRAAANYHAGTE